MSATAPNIQPAIITPDDGTRFNGVVTTLRAEDTGGRYSIVDFTLDAGSHAPAPHLHDTFDEVYHVTEGTLTVLLDGATHEAPVGSTIFVPRGTVHTISNTGTVPTRFVFMMSPGGFERCFDELNQARVRDGDVSPTVFAEITSRYDVRIVAPEG